MELDANRQKSQETLELKALPAHSAEVRQGHSGNWRPGQRIQQRRARDIPGIEGLASVFSRGAPVTFQELKAWPEYSAEVRQGHSGN